MKEENYIGRWVDVKSYKDKDTFARKDYIQIDRIDGKTRYGHFKECSQAINISAWSHYIMPEGFSPITQSNSLLESFIIF